MMEPVAAKAHELPWQEHEAAELRAELQLMKTAGIIEVAVRNPSVAEYMAHWEGRATDAEARIRELEAAADQCEAQATEDDTGAIWRHWRAKAETSAARIAELEAENERLKDRLTEVAHQREDVKWTALTHGLNKMSAEARAEALEALLEEAGKALEPFAHRCDEAVRPDDMDNDGLTVRVGHLRAARAIHDKIGGGGENT